MYRIQIVLILFSLQNFTGFSQEIKYYHTFETTDSEIRLTEWRVDFENKGEKYIIETVDNQNRVKELRLIDNGNLYDSDCYNVSIIRFEYKKDTIIQYNMESDTFYSVEIECGDPSKIVYILVNQNIKQSISYTYYDQILSGKYKLEADFRSYIENEKEKNINGNEGNANFILGYQFSSSRYYGCLPIRESFAFEEKEWYHYPYSENAAKSEFAIQNSKYLRNKNKND